MNDASTDNYEDMERALRNYLTKPVHLEAKHPADRAKAWRWMSASCLLPLASCLLPSVMP